MSAFTNIAFDPALPWLLIGVLAATSLAAVSYALWRRASGVSWRALALAAGLLALTNPSLVEEDRKQLPDVAVVVIDDSPSQGIGDRRKQAAEAEAAIRERLGNKPELDLRIVHAGNPDGSANGPIEDGTRLFEAIDRALADTPRERVAGVVLVTDGQVHDIPLPGVAAKLGGPVHVLLTGKRGETDRRLVIEQAPSYGIVGQPTSITLRVEEPGAAGTTASVTMRIEGGPPISMSVTIGESRTVPFVLQHGGPTVIELEAAPGEHELTLQNNRAAVVVNGVRDRLKVLLVSGEPHAGERTWRNLLKADPAVDLVHFTILRPPEKQDGTPIRELSLIAFPIRELFEAKINEFDLIIFDRYRRRGVLPTAYFQNIADYVTRGGALLEASGPAYATPLSLARTPLAEVLPGKPTGGVQIQGFTPTLTATGRRHPVTADLPGGEAEKPTWGRWFRQIDVERTAGEVLMSGVGDRPLLLLDRIGKGRVAQIFSDHVWLWARGFEGGGPQAELLRRLAHWLMKEPELEENDLRAVANGNRLEITRRSLKPDTRPVTVTAPSGATREVKLEEAHGGREIGQMPVSEPGLYRLTDGEHRAIAAVGAINPKEFADVRASPGPLTPVVEATKGSIRWLSDGMPDLRLITPPRDTSGRSWIGLIAHRDYLVTGVRQLPLLPVVLVLTLLLGGLMLAWQREGR